MSYYNEDILSLIHKKFKSYSNFDYMINGFNSSLINARNLLPFGGIKNNISKNLNEMENVVRIFDLDFIFFDIIFAIIWISLLLKINYRRELAFGIAGTIFIFFLDYFFWRVIQKTRMYEGPIPTLLFFIYFSSTYGMIMFSYVILMFREENFERKVIWTVLLYTGWILSAILSNLISLNDTEIITSRIMSRETQILYVFISYAILLILKLSWKPLQNVELRYFFYLFLVGFLVQFGMEFTLFVSGIRPNEPWILIFNSLVEFNQGVPILYAGWKYLKTSNYSEN